jgi:hypothetical protein
MHFDLVAGNCFGSRALDCVQILKSACCGLHESFLGLCVTQVSRHLCAEKPEIMPHATAPFGLSLTWIE